MRRSGGQSEDKKVSFDNLVISLDNYSVLLDGKPVEMPPKEIELLYFLASRPERYLPGSSCWSRCGALTFSEIPEQWTFM